MSGQKTAGRIAASSKQNFDAIQLNNWADMLLGIPFRSGRAPTADEIEQSLQELNQGVSLRTPIMSDADRWSIANLLREIAMRPIVATAIHTPRKVVGRPKKRRIAARNWKIALDYELTKERFENEKAAKPGYAAEVEICAAWPTSRTKKARSRSSVLNAYKECKKLDVWKTWADYERKAFALTADAALDKGQLLRGLSAILRSPNNSAE